MGKIRLSEIGVEAGFGAKEALKKAKEMGLNVKTSASSVSEDEATKILQFLSTGINPMQNVPNIKEEKADKKPTKSTKTSMAKSEKLPQTTKAIKTTKEPKKTQETSIMDVDKPKIIHSFIYTIDMLYVCILGIGIGCIITCGIFAAPVIFGAASWLPHLEVADSGLIMGQIFIKCGKLFNILAGLMIIYEILTLVTAGIFASSMQRRVWFLLGGISVIMILLFTLYYTPAIMEAQAAGMTNTQEFYSMHKQSELVFQILLITLSIEAIWRGVVGSLPFNANAEKKSCCS